MRDKFGKQRQDKINKRLNLRRTFSLIDVGTPHLFVHWNFRFKSMNNFYYVEGQTGRKASAYTQITPWIFFHKPIYVLQREHWQLNYEIHSLTPEEADTWITALCIFTNFNVIFLQKHHLWFCIIISLQSSEVIPPWHW